VEDDVEDDDDEDVVDVAEDDDDDLDDDGDLLLTLFSFGVTKSFFLFLMYNCGLVAILFVGE
jgi:hypothetical protein